MFKAAIFDLDGTLVDSLPDIGLAANMALQHLGLRTFTVPEYQTFAGGGHWRLLTKAITLAQDGVPPTEDMLNRAVAIKKRQEDGPHGHDNTKAFPGIHDMMRSLQREGIQLAILSNKGEPTVRNIVSRVFPDIKFAHVGGQRDDTPLKPDPSAALNIIENIFEDVSLSEVVFIGDTDIDMRTAVAAGVTPVAVPWGCRTPDVLTANGASRVVKTVDEISKIILRAPESPVAANEFS